MKQFLFLTEKKTRDEGKSKRRKKTKEENNEERDSDDEQEEEEEEEEWETDESGEEMEGLLNCLLF